jgi:purine catabolism regulator
MTPSERREVNSIRTDRPEGAVADHTGLDALPTVAEAIADPAFLAGDPEVITGHAALGNKVRWVHASDNADVARFFAGGELLISTGQGWPDADASLTTFVEGLGAAGVAGIVLELGTRFAHAPLAMVETAARIGLPLVVLRSEVRFVDLTEAIHRRIIGSQMEALRAHADVRERFTALALRGAPADHVVSQLARTLSAPVVLENLAHEVIVAEAVGSADADVLADWERRSRAAHAQPAADREWLIVPVDARGTRWGSLIALPGAAHPAGRLSVLEQGAIALAIGCLADGGADEWARIARRGLLEGLLGGHFATAADARARLEAAGLPIECRRLYGIAVGFGTSSQGAPIGPAAVESAAVTVGAVARALTLDGSGAPMTVALLSFPPTRVFDEAAARGLLKELGDGPRLSLTIGRAATDVDEALASMADAMNHATDASADRLPVL